MNCAFASLCLHVCVLHVCGSMFAFGCSIWISAFGCLRSELACGFVRYKLRLDVRFWICVWVLCLDVEFYLSSSDFAFGFAFGFLRFGFCVLAQGPLDHQPDASSFGQGQ